jgi:5,10-methylenetetrahydromethanopterin reductase
MRIGMFRGDIADGPVEAIVEAAGMANDAGYATFWLPQIFGHDAITALAVVGAQVPRIELGTAVVPTYPRHPIMLAEQAITTNAFSGGRLALGIGLSHQLVIENMYGLSFEKPLRHMREYLSILVPLAREGRVSFAGETLTGHMGFSIKDAAPFPILVAALGTKMLELAGTVADGTLTWMTGPATVESHVVPMITAAAQAADRPAPRVGVGLPVCVTDDPDGARELAAKTFEVYGTLPSYRAMLDREGAAGPADVALVGSEAEVAAAVQRLADGGATDFVAAPFGSGDDLRRTDAALRALL